MTEHSWSVPIAVNDVPEAGRHYRLVADEQTRTAVAALAGLRALSRLEARFEVLRRGRDGLRVVGRVAATVGQACVVTLEPVDNEVDEAIDLVFAPPAAPVFIEEDGSRIEIAPVDAPEPLLGGTIDLGEIAVEFLILGLDPYPRKAGVVFDAPPDGDGGAHPFAALAALKKSDKI